HPSRDATSPGSGRVVFHPRRAGIASYNTSPVLLLQGPSVIHNGACTTPSAPLRPTFNHFNPLCVNKNFCDLFESYSQSDAALRKPLKKHDFFQIVALGLLVTKGLANPREDNCGLTLYLPQ